MFFWHVESSKAQRAQGTHWFEGARGTMVQQQWIWREAFLISFIFCFAWIADMIRLTSPDVRRCLGYMQSYDKAFPRSSDPGTCLRCLPRCAWMSRDSNEKRKGKPEALQGWWNVTWYFLTSVFSMIFLLDSWLFVNHLHPLKSSVFHERLRAAGLAQGATQCQWFRDSMAGGLAFGVLPFSAAFPEIQLHFWGGGLEVLVVSLRGFLWWNELWNDI